MARIARVVVPDIPHHVVQRGVRRMHVFFSDADREEYLSLLSAEAKRRGLEFLAWCLMSNHVHLVVVPHHERSLAASLGEAHRKYTSKINMREGCRGHLWQERFHSYPLDDSHLMAAVRYVEVNPVRAGLVERAQDWEWSSARFHLGLEKRDRLLSEGTLFGLVGDWQSFLENEITPKGENMELHLRTGRPFGPSYFVEKLEKLAGRRLRPSRGGWPKGKKRK